MRNENNSTIFKTKLWKKSLCILLSVIMALGTFVTMTFGSLTLSDYIDFRNLITAEAAIVPSVPIFYRHGELVGVYTVNYQDNTKLQYRIGDDGTWTDYSVPFAIPAHKTTKVYARVGTSGRPIYMLLSNTNKALGVYTESNTDFEFSYNNINFGYTRTYNSADKDWFESIHSKVLVTDSRLEVTLPDGSKYPMIKNGTNTYIDELNGYTLTKTNTDYIFDDGKYKYYFAIKLLQTAALLSAIEDYSGNRLNLNRTTNSDEISISDGAGRSFALSDYRVIDAPDGSDAKYYSVKEITDPNGNKIEYTTKYDRYIQVKDQAGVLLGQYEYMSDTTNHTLIKSNDKSIEYYANGRLKQITYDNGSWIKYTYDDTNMSFATLASNGESTKTIYNDNFLPVEYLDEYGVNTTYSYDNHYRLKSEINDKIAITYNYDTKGNMISYTTGDIESDTYYTYDSNDNITREQRGNDFIYYKYDDNKNILVYATLQEDFVGDAPTEYDSSLNCFDTVCYNYDNKGRITKEVNSCGSIYQYEYDDAGNILKETVSFIENDKTETTVTSYTYDDMDNILTIKCDNDTSSYIYDNAGRTILANENGNCTRKIYDEYGRITREISPEDYDASKDRLPEFNEYEDTKAGHTYTYLNNGNIASETNRLGNTTTYIYYPTGEKKKEIFDIYEYNYTKLGDLESVKVAGTTTVSYIYDDKHNLLSECYANGNKIRYEYDDNNNLINQYHNDDSKPYVTFMYDDKNMLIQKINTDIDLKYIYGDNNKTDIYKVSDNSLVYSYEESTIESSEDNDDQPYLSISEKHFDKNYHIKTTNNSISYSSYNSDIEYSYYIEDDKKISDSVKFDNSIALSSTYDYDSDMNIIKKEYNNMIFENYYNENGNLLSHSIGNDYNVFEYDSNNQLIFSDNYYIPCEYTYDSRGNITSKYSGTDNDKVFIYDENDVLISVNDVELTYDEIGNVLAFGDKQFYWNSGRNLEAFCDGTVDCEYSYDENGIRVSKTVNGNTIYYNTKDGIILSQTDGVDTLYFQYDNNNTPIGFLYNDIQCFYITNQMGDVIAIALFNGEIIANYSYDPWGELISIDLPYDYDIFREIAEANPLRYRGYYYDKESGYYYLQSRYYDPSICRFINADDVNFVDVNTVCGLNIFAYCCNNPVNNADYNGYWGGPVHSGYKSKGYYYSVVSNGKRYYYGTYYWAYLGCGFKENDAKTLAIYCFDLDKYFSSTKYFDALYANDNYRRNGLKPIYSQKQLNTFKSWQYYHFNGYAKGSADTRRTYANNQKNIAVQNWKKNRNYALKMLGYGLHAIQDISAHGQIGRGADMPQHIFLAPNNRSLFTQADTIQGYIWKNSSRNGLKSSKGSVSRLLEAQTDTYNYLNSFIKSIGGKNKLK